MMFSKFISLCFILLYSAAGLAVGKCETVSKVSGFSTIKDSVKAYFYKDPIACESKKNCQSRKKAFLVAKNFVQTGEIQNKFVCVVFRNFDGYGGKKTIGWIMLDDLNPIRSKVERKDLMGNWTQMPCAAGDDCGLSISEENGKLEVFVDSHIHDRPGSSFEVSSISEPDGSLVLTGKVSEKEHEEKLVIRYSTPDSEPGTVSVTGIDFFKGTYYK